MRQPDERPPNSRKPAGVRADGSTSAVRVADQPEASLAMRVTGQVEIDCTAIRFGDRDHWSKVAEAFWIASDIPAGATVTLRLPSNGDRLWLDRAFCGWSNPLPEIRWIVVGPKSEQVRAACTDLRAAIAAANVPPVQWSGEWPDLGETA